MTSLSVLENLANKKIKPEQAVKEVVKNPKLLNEVLEGISSDKGAVKFGCAKVLQLLSKSHPEMLYPQWDFFVDLLDNKNNILKWDGIIILANLTVVDKDKKFEKIFDKYFGLINDSKMITAANVVGHSHIIVKAKPVLTQKIVNRLLKVEKGKWKTKECKNIVLGKAIIAFGKFWDQVNDKEKVIKFVKRQVNNTRAATKNKAKKFLKKYEK